ncbi:MAG: tetratricopeptide repeat protein [Chitinispirillaceae bacterium]|nr:tetratricopeptide repeat protein [Chitinispirillaceae bacterium]
MIFQLRLSYYVTLIFLTIATNSFSKVLQEANELYNKGKFKEAIALYKKAIEEGENKALSYFNLANTYFQIDSLPQCVVYYRAAVEEAPDFFRGHLNLAITYYSLEDIGNAIASIKRALEIEPTNSRAQLILAACYRKIGAKKEAIIAFEQLLKKENNPDYLIALGEMYSELDDYETANKYLEEYPENGNKIGYVLKLLTENYKKLGLYNKVIFVLQKAIELKPSDVSLYITFCQTLENMGNIAVAYEEAKRYNIQFPESGELALFAGNCAFKLGRLVEAEYYYSIAKKHGIAGAITGLENVKLMMNRTK